MEIVKQFNSKRSGEGVLLGETSRSDLLEGEGVSHITVPQWDGTQPESRLRDFKFPQPKLAQSHTENNVCIALFFFFIPFFRRAPFTFSPTDLQMPTSFNWFNVSNVKHPAMNQGACGCCWAFAAINALEMQSVLEGNPFISLSKQQAVDWFVSMPHQKNSQ